MKAKIEHIEPQFAQKLDNPFKSVLQELRYPVPPGYRLRVSLLDANGRKKRSDASADKWSPQSGRIEIRFEPALEEEKIATPEGPHGTAGKSSPQANCFTEGFSGPNTFVAPLEIRLLKALNSAESTPGWKFVSLKKFRDEVLPSEASAPGDFQPTDVHWQEAIRNAIEKRLILTSKVPNPKSPQFPVTSIRLNRLMPEVQEVLGLSKRDLGFHPIHIKGEPLSATVLRERR
jgi:hypothetical protein